MTPRTVKADASVRRGRMAKAEQFAAAALVVHELADEAADVKTLAGYSHTPISGDRALRAGRATEALLEAARAAR